MTDLETPAPPPLVAPPPAGAPAPEPAQPEHRHLGVALVVICLAQLMVVLDASIVNVALPSIQRALHFSSANLIWVVNAYTLAFGGLLLLGGRTGDLFGRRRMFLVGVALFTAASLAGGLAVDEGWLIAARVVQGIGGAVAAPTALALIADTFPEGRPRHRAMGMYAALTGAGAVIGVLLGGALTSALGWRWVLFVNVPIGVLVVAATPLVLGETGTRHGRLDLPGAVSSTAGMTLVVYGLIHAATTSWGNGITVTALTAGGALLVAFLVLEARTRHPLMPLGIFRSWARSTAYGVVLAIGTAVFSMFYFGTLFMQGVLGYDPLKTGVAYLAPSMVVLVTAGVTSRLLARTGYRAPLVAGCALAAAGLAWFAQVTPQSSYLDGMLGPFLMIGAGMGLCFVPLTTIAIAGVAPAEEGIAAALLNTGQQIGGTLGLAVLGSIAVATTRHLLASATRTVGARSAGSAHAATAAASPASSAALHHAVAAAQVSGYTTAFAAGAGIMVFALILSTVGLRGARVEPAAGRGVVL